MPIPVPSPFARRLAVICGWLLLAIFPLLAQPDRIADSVDVAKTKLLAGNRSPKALLPDDQGPVDSSQRIGGITIVFKPSAGQTADLGQLLQQQRDPASPNYRKWLTPDQYGDRFGLSRNDLAKVTSWLEAEGFRVDYVARGRTWVMFSGTAGQVLGAFHTAVHRYSVQGELHFANAADPAIPAALSPVVLLIRGLDDFRTEPRRPNALPVANFTASNGGHALVPGDIATIYDIGPLYQAGITGTGQKVAVVGQTDIYLSDIEHFRSQFGLPANNPELVLVAGSPDPGVSSGDLVEASLDLEYSGGIAPNATILFVYSIDVWTSIIYAVDQALAPVISTSYGYCEPQISSAPASTAAYLQSIAEQANSMGITWVASSGDTGAADCDLTSEQAARQGLAVDLPASVPEVTGVGGTEFMEGSGRYWASTNNSNGSSALSYIPEMAWNDTAALGALAATGGGASIFFVKPSWQSGTGVPNDGARDVPDLSFSSAVAHDPYQIYVDGEVVYVGGTSAPTPMFAGVLALLNQYQVSSGSQSQPGLGNINPTLYRLAQTAGIFHDVTVGNNILPCASGSPNCTNGELGYSAGVGYDRTTGLGSVDVYNLVTLWKSSQPVATTTTVTPSVASINTDGSTLLTATVQAVAGIAVPNGSVSFTYGQTLLGTVALSVSGGVATAALTVKGSQLAAGVDSITASYSGSAAFIGSSGSSSVSVTAVNVAVNSVTPNSGSGASQTFGLVYSDTAGAASLLGAYAWFNATLANSAASSCFVNYDNAVNQINLMNDAGTAWLTATPGAATTLQNSQCTVNVAATSVATSGNTLTLNLAMTFQPAYSGAKNTYMYGTDISGANSGWQQVGTWIAQLVPGTPATVSVTPNSGSGSSQTFALVYSDTAGAASLQVTYAWFNATLANSAASSCFVNYSSGLNQINLLNDAGTAWLTATPGAAITLQNSQCSVNVAATSVAKSGNTLTLNLAMTFQPAYAGAKNTYMYAADVSGANSGWQQEGAWTAQSVSGTPATVSVTPNSGSGTSQTFALVYSDTAGAASLHGVWAWFNATLATSAASSCFVNYDNAVNQINLMNDAGTAWLTATPGSGGTLANSQCSVNVAATSVAKSGSTLTLNLAMTFLPAYAGAKNTYMYAADVSGANSGWQQLGTWTAQSLSGTPATVSVTPNSGSGASQTVALVYSDTAGAASLQGVWAWFNATLADSAASSCFVNYDTAVNQINLMNDAGTAWLTATPGAATMLANSQCSVNVAATSVVPSGNTLTLNLAMTFEAGYAGAKNIYMYDADVSGANSGWQQLGTWTAQ
jgi:Pro-kumamolisin, activation domain/Bacterial Ig-like domain (group 3)